jgi:hypothetical protein
MLSKWVMLPVLLAAAWILAETTLAHADAEGSRKARGSSGRSDLPPAQQPATAEHDYCIVVR